MPRVSLRGADIEALSVAGRASLSFESQHATLTIAEEKDLARLMEMKSRWVKDEDGGAHILLFSERPEDVIMVNGWRVDGFEYAVKRGVSIVDALDIVLSTV